VNKALERKQNKLYITLCNNDNNSNNILNTKLKSQTINKIQDKLLYTRYDVYNKKEYTYNNLVYNITDNEYCKNVFKSHQVFNLNSELKLYCNYINKTDINALEFPSKKNYHKETTDQVVKFNYTDSMIIRIINHSKIQIDITIDSHIDNTISKLYSLLKDIN
jgi:hypothetical protein